MALTGGTLRSLSLEIFTPRSTKGIDDLLASGGRLAAYAALGPSLVSVNGPGLQILEHVRATHSIRPQMQISRPEVTLDSIESMLDSAMGVGVRDVLILGGQPGQRTAPGAFSSVLDLVRCIKERCGERMRVSVCGYPRGACGELGEYDADLQALALQVAAGAELVVSLPCFDAETHSEFAADARAAGVRCPIVPGLLPVGSVAADFRRICRAIAVEVPKWLDDQLLATSTSECACLPPMAFGCRGCPQMRTISIPPSL
jgi:methylenetetrahydrofolate reductase (NADPH)